MDKKKKVRLLVNMVLTCTWALMWNINVIAGFAYAYSLGLRIFTAIGWDIVAGIWVFRYIKSRKNSAGG